MVLLVSLKQTKGLNVRSGQERYYENPLVLSVQESEKFEGHCKNGESQFGKQTKRGDCAYTVLVFVTDGRAD